MARSTCMQHYVIVLGTGIPYPLMAAHLQKNPFACLMPENQESKCPFPCVCKNPKNIEHALGHSHTLPALARMFAKESIARFCLGICPAQHYHIM